MVEKIDFITSDTHFQHENIIKYCNRPFANTDEMDEFIITEWNKLVKSDDIILHLGDVGFGNKERLAEKINALNGYKILIRGNHDPKTVRKMLELGFNEAYKQSLTIGNYIFSHKPMEDLSFDIINVHGHIHNCLDLVPNYNPIGHINVSMDVTGFKPVRFKI